MPIRPLQPPAPVAAMPCGVPRGINPSAGIRSSYQPATGRPPAGCLSLPQSCHEHAIEFRVIGLESGFG
jgi:hypothetical protein